MFGLAFSGVYQALLLQIFDVDIEQATEADAIIKDFAGPFSVGMHLEHLLVTGYHRGNAAHIDDGLANAFHIQFLGIGTQQKDHLVAKLFLNFYTALFDG